MRPWRLFLAVPLALASLRADDALPKAQPAAVYEPMASRSPFTAPTAATPVPAATPATTGPHWWDQMNVTSLMEAGGVYFAAVVDKASGKRYVLESGKTDEDSHLLLANVQWSERPDQSTITVRKGAEIAPPLRFDASAVAAPPTNAPQPFTPGNPPHYQTPMSNNPPLPPGFTGTPPPPPPATSVVHRSNPIGARPVAPGNPPGAPPALPPPADASRRRVRPLGANDGAN